MSAFQAGQYVCYELEIRNSSVTHSKRMTEKQDKPQVEKFSETARELDTDNSEPRFDSILKKISPVKKGEKPQDKAHST